MGLQTTVLAGFGVLLAAMVPIQMLAYMRMRGDIRDGLRELGDQHGRETSGSAATLVFILYAFLSGYLHTNEIDGFRRTAPFEPIYHFVQHFIHASTREDLAWMFPWIWGILTILPPCLVYVALNAYVARLIWTHMR